MESDNKKPWSKLALAGSLALGGLIGFGLNSSADDPEVVVVTVPLTTPEPHVEQNRSTTAEELGAARDELVRLYCELHANGMSWGEVTVAVAAMLVEDGDYSDELLVFLQATLDEAEASC